LDDFQKAQLDRRFLAMAPYGVPVIRDGLAAESRDTRLFAAETAGDLANEELCSELGVPRDTSLLPDLLDMLVRENDLQVLYGTYLTLPFYAHSEEAAVAGHRLRRVLQTGLEGKSPDVRLAASLAMLKILPEEGVSAVKRKLEEPGFVSYEGRQIIGQMLDTASGGSAHGTRD
jgi:hypothetical protein